MKKTIMFVSHDIDEAVKMGDRIAIFREGRLVQYDTPDNILAHPKNRFVSDFVGADRTLKRLQLLKVTDAMMHDPPSVRAEDTLAQAAALMEENGHTRRSSWSGRRPGPRLSSTSKTAQGAKGKVGENHETLPTTITSPRICAPPSRPCSATTSPGSPASTTTRIFKGYVTLRGITHLLGEAHRDG